MYVRNRHRLINVKLSQMYSLQVKQFVCVTVHQENYDSEYCISTTAIFLVHTKKRENNLFQLKIKGVSQVGISGACVALRP